MKVTNPMSPQNADLDLHRDCCICLNLMIEPVRLACGHRFCGTCLKQAANEKPRCPLCRVKSPTADQIGAKDIDVGFQKQLKTAYPDEFYTRKTELNKSNQLLGSKIDLVFTVGNRYRKLKAGQY